MTRLLPEEKKKVRKPLLYIGIASIVMTFAGLTSGYVVSRSALLADNRWLQFELPMEFTWASVAIVLSSITMIWAGSAVKKRMYAQMRTALGFTLALGFTFVLLQFLGWQDLISRGLYFTGEGSNTAIAWVYVLTFIHWLHVVSGIIVLLVTIFQATKGAYTSEEHQGLSLSSIYWHFLDALWIYLFLFLVFIR